MLLIDIGNSTVVTALADAAGNIVSTFRFKTQKDASASYFRGEFKAGFDHCGINTADVTQVVASSVVPEVNDDVAQAIADLTGCATRFFGVDDARRLIGIDIDSLAQLGRDRLADAVGAAVCYGAPVIVIDMGTATTIGVVDGNRTFIGGMIIPGVKTSLKALSERASQLPSIDIAAAQNYIGRNTLECMQSGIVNGTAAMLDGIVSIISAKLGGAVRVVATGGMADSIVPHCRLKITIDRHLQFKGIFHAMQASAADGRQHRPQP